MLGLRFEASLQTAGRSDANPRNKKTGPVKKPSALETFSSNAGLMKSLRTCHLASFGTPKSRSQPSISSHHSVRKKAATAKSSSNAHILFAVCLFVCVRAHTWCEWTCKLMHVDASWYTWTRRISVLPLRSWTVWWSNVFARDLAGWMQVSRWLDDLSRLGRGERNGKEARQQDILRHLEQFCTDFLSYKIAIDCNRLHLFS